VLQRDIMLIARKSVISTFVLGCLIVQSADVRPFDHQCDDQHQHGYFSDSTDIVPLFLKFHKVGSTAVTTLIQNLCSDEWWNATDSKKAKYVSQDDFCCSNPYWHQTIHQYRSAGICSLKRCTIGYTQGIRMVKVFSIFREPNAKFVSGMYFFSRWELRKKLFSTHPANLTMDEFDMIAKAALYVRMKAPVHEYVEILGQSEKSVQWKEKIDHSIIDKAKANLKRDVDGIGILENFDSFIILLTLELKWNPEHVPCLGKINTGHFSSVETSSATTTASKSMNSEGTITYGFKDLRQDQQNFVSNMMLPEKEVYDYAKELAQLQEKKHDQFEVHKALYQQRCTSEHPSSSSSSSSFSPNMNLRITSMRHDLVRTTQQTGKSCAIDHLT
jgi:hypothetical protein